MYECPDRAVSPPASDGDGDDDDYTEMLILTLVSFSVDGMSFLTRGT